MHKNKLKHTTLLNEKNNNKGLQWVSLTNVVHIDKYNLSMPLKQIQVLWILATHIGHVWVSIGANCTFNVNLTNATGVIYDF